ncbi:hypothetical protein BACCIP111883_04079 [Sutcliffiella rhizosphaerae]|uniref:Lipoprotein n=2 Tax=Sutcliffiella rhizosphaerae TaxID=2880967 RepID=A0ABN8AJA5_9BACI|nr:hypothetical protein BACCIP111883_04079 [Sutcliffiella rhizosphaerae]
MKILRRSLLLVSLLVVGSVLTACSDIVNKISEQAEAEEGILAYLEVSNPVIESGVATEIEADEFVFGAEDMEQAHAFLVKTTIPALEKLVKDTESIVVTFEPLQPSHDKLIEANKKLLEAYSTYADGFYNEDESLLEEADLLYDEYGVIFDEHEVLFTEVTDEYNVDVEIEE